MFHIKPVYAYYDLLGKQGTCMAFPMDNPNGGQWGPPVPVVLHGETPEAIEEAYVDLLDAPGCLILAIGEASMRVSAPDEATWYMTLIVQWRRSDATDQRDLAQEDRQPASDGRAGDAAGSGDRRWQDQQTPAEAQPLPR